MNKPNRASHRINDKNGAAIRDINPQSNAALTCDKAIGAIEAPVLEERLFNHCGFIPVHLLSGGKRHSAKPETLAKIAMDLSEPGQRLLPVGHNVDSGDSANEPVPDGSERLQGGKKFQ